MLLFVHLTCAHFSVPVCTHISTHAHMINDEHNLPFTGQHLLKQHSGRKTRRSLRLRKSFQEGYLKIWIKALKGIHRQIKLYGPCKRKKSSHTDYIARPGKIRVLLHFISGAAFCIHNSQ